MAIASSRSLEAGRWAMYHPSDSYIEVNDHVLILEGELLGCTGKVTNVGAGGLLVVKIDPPDEDHPPIVISDASVQLQDLAKSHG
jgi:hypothetical protein